VTAILPAPAYVLALAAWIRTVVLWHAEGRFTRLDGATGTPRRWPQAGGCGRRPTFREGVSHEDSRATDTHGNRRVAAAMGRSL